MKKTILGESRDTFSKKLNKQKLLAVGLGVVAAALSILFVTLRNDSNHTLMYILTVTVGVIYGWFLVAFLNLTIIPRQKLLKLSLSKLSRYRGEITNISEDTLQMRGIDCRRITVGEEERVFFAPCTLELTVGKSVVFSAASNIIVEVAYE